MNKTELLQTEIKHILDLLKIFPEEDTDKVKQAIDALNDVDLEKLLKILYKVEQSYFSLLDVDMRNMEKLLKNLPAHE